MRTIADCLHALNKAPYSNTFTVIERKVASDVIRHLLRLWEKDGAPTKRQWCETCDCELGPRLCPDCHVIDGYTKGQVRAGMIAGFIMGMAFAVALIRMF